MKQYEREERVTTTEAAEIALAVVVAAAIASYMCHSLIP